MTFLIRYQGDKAEEEIFFEWIERARYTKTSKMKKMYIQCFLEIFAIESWRHFQMNTENDLSRKKKGRELNEIEILNIAPQRSDTNF